MIILALTLTAWAILRKYAAKPRKITAAPVVVYEPAPAEIRRGAEERERFEEYEQHRQEELRLIRAQRRAEEAAEAAQS